MPKYPGRRLTPKAKVTLDPEYRISIALKSLRYAKNQLQQALHSNPDRKPDGLTLAYQAVHDPVEAVNQLMSQIERTTNR